MSPAWSTMGTMEPETERVPIEPVIAQADCRVCRWKVPVQEHAREVEQRARQHAIDTRHPVRIIRTATFEVRRITRHAEG